MGQGWTPNWRRRGGVLIAVGLFLVLLMGGIAWKLAPMLLRPGVETDGTTFTGTAEQGELYLGLFAAVGLFGLVSIVNGGHMIATGRRSQALTSVTILLFSLLYALGWAVRRGLV